jgi:hypothetical protein
MGIDDVNPRCMDNSCKKQWTLEFLSESFPMTFHGKEYLQRRASIIMEREKSLLPITQETKVLPTIRKREYDAARLNLRKSFLTVSSQLKTIFREIESCASVIKELLSKIKIKSTDPITKSDCFPLNEVDEKLNNIEKLKRVRQIKNIKSVERKIVNEHKASLGIAIDVLDIDYYSAEGVEKKKSRGVFTKKCVIEDCRGYLSTSYKCGLCEVFVCPKCHVPKEKREDESHKCDPDLVETIKLLKNDTKDCPACSCPIFKTEGCDQMYCTQCHTAFSWRRGTIETGRIHNPHFYEYQRAQNDGVAPRVPGDVPCGGLCNLDEVGRQCRDFNIDIKSWGGFNAHRLVGHINAVVIPNLMTIPDDEFERLRIYYLLGDIDEKRWMASLKKLVKQSEKNKEIVMVLRMFVDSATHLFNNFIIAGDLDEAVKITVEFRGLRDYVNAHLIKIGNRFKQVFYTISGNWRYLKYIM